MTVDHGGLADFIGFAVTRPGLHPSAGHPVGEALRIVVAPARLASGIEGFRDGHSAELAAPDNKGFLE